MAAGTNDDRTVRMSLDELPDPGATRRQSALDALPTTGDLTAAIAAEAEAREKADQLLETEIEGKLDAADLVAGDNITITPDPESGKVTIDNTMNVATNEYVGIVKPDGTSITVDSDGIISAHDEDPGFYFSYDTVSERKYLSLVTPE